MIQVHDFTVTTEMENAKIGISEVRADGDSVIFKISVRPERKMTPSPVRMECRIPLGNVLSVWSPLLGFSRFLAPSWRRTKCESKTAVGAPVLSLIGYDGINACTVAVSDPKTPLEIGAGVSEEDAVFLCNVTFFTAYISPVESYEAYLRMDFSEIPFLDAVKGVRAWWKDQFGYAEAYVPPEARLPMYSTWYSFHQNLEPKRLLEECAISARLGMKTVIIDDGWQTSNCQRGYQYCGDWIPSPAKIADFKALTNGIHALGMKVMLWYSVPFVGIHSRAYQRFCDKALKEEKDVLILDIRYREVRDYLTEIYLEAVQAFGLDGLKLDFIDKFQLFETSPAANDQMDIPSVEDALEALLRGIRERLVEIDPEILLEFRQRYVGPAVLKYGNMIRVGDCPGDSLRNRVGITDLKCTSGETAVHSDMLMWSRDASVETVARQLISTLFGVPQISVLLRDLPQTHLETIRFWLQFQTENRDVLQGGGISVKNPELGYTQITAAKDGRVISVNYANVPFETVKTENGKGRYTLVNSSDEEKLCIRFAEDMGACRIRICDCLGKTVEEAVVTVDEEIQMLRVPVCGFVDVECLGTLA